MLTKDNAHNQYELREKAMGMIGTLLVIGHQKHFLKIMARLLKGQNIYNFQTFSNYPELVSFLEMESDIFLAVSDLTLDGYEHKLIIDELIIRNIPVIAVSSNVNDDLLDQIWEKNIVHFIKYQHHLDLLFTSYLAERLIYFKNKKAIIIDDSKTFGELTQNYLTTLLFDVKVFENGIPAIDYLDENCDIKLAIVDYQLPDLTGIELTRLIREALGFKIIIIAVTGHSSSEIKYSFFKSGADDYIEKPFTKEEFNAIVVKNMRHVEQLDKIENLSVIDHLTNIFNRKHLISTLEKKINEAERYQKQFSIILFDIDLFKRINDQYGHNRGDFILKELSKLVQQNIRKTDTFGRWGGEEFIIITPNTNLEKASELGEQLRILIENHNFGLDDLVSCSFGVSNYETGDNIDSLINKADIALYKAKKNGRNRLYIYH